jgi:hypothetical protein
MASSKKYYWKREMPTNRILLKVEEDGTKVFLPTEDLGSPNGFPIGYSIVDEETNKLVEPMDGKFGISAGTKEDYDSLKKKDQSSPSKPQWREEISPTQSVKKSRSVGKSVAAAKEPAQAAIEVQSVSATLPEDSKPKVGKRKSADTTED